MSNNKNVTPLNLDILEMLSRTKGGALLFSKLGKVCQDDIVPAFTFTWHETNHI